ncbi:MAG: DUF885 domain-containing protein [Acidimicrobiia bacterium]|nr:DUF885 domain-containing protein [Acidimicrobiia bacterium]
MSKVFEVAARYVERFAELDPVAATEAGIPGHDGQMTDYSPEGIEERVAHDRRALAELAAAPVAGERDRVAAEAVVERLRVAIDRHDAGEALRDLNILASPVQAVRQCFDLVPSATEADWETIAARLGLVPQALAGYQATLAEGARRGVVAARRQAVACTRQADTWGGVSGEGTPYFLALLDRFDEAGIDRPSLRDRLERDARRATEAYAALGRFLVSEYAPHADERDAVGEDRYRLWAAAFNGVDLDLPETYAWGWEELERIGHAIGEVAERILPGAPVAEVIEHLETDPHRSIEGEEAFRSWLQDLMDATVAELDGTHFDIPDPVKRVEAMIAPPGGAAAMYYTPPSEDFARPGRTWYPTLGRTRFPLWGEVSIAYHEGVPGHHLQIGQVLVLADELSRFQRTLGFVSGHGEGWALYAERLMGELGYLDDPAYELGMLRAQALRAVRVVVDIGMHLELAIPPSCAYHPGETWTAELALPFVIERSHFPADFLASEVDRYLGLPGQAISYKVGEREWLAAREDARRIAGRDFDLKAFHTRALDLGPMGLAQFRREMARSRT